MTGAVTFTVVTPIGNVLSLPMTIGVPFTEVLITDTVTVFVYPEIRIPNGFSNNGDGKNDVWQIDNINQFPDNTVEVYNRGGELLFYSRGYAVPFDGKYKGKNLPVGTYYYVINLNSPEQTKPYTGPLTIFR